jgi:hypothetical protein
VGEKEGGGWFSSVAPYLGFPHAAVEGTEGVKATGEAVEHAEQAMAPNAAGYAPALVAPEVAGAAAGAPTFGQTVSAAQHAAGGGGALNMANKVLAPLALASGAYDMYGSGKDMKEHGANLENTPDMVKGGAEVVSGGIGTVGLGGAILSGLGFGGAGAAATGAAAAAAPVAAVAGAGAAGMAVGAGMANVADSDLTKTGAWGKNDSGNNNSAMDWGAGWGTWVDSHTGDKNPADPSILGGIAAGAGGIVGGFAGTAQAGWNKAASWL